MDDWVLWVIAAGALAVGEMATLGFFLGPLAVAALVAAVVAMGALACELGHQLDAVDVNPLVVHPGGTVAVDALVLPRALGGQSG